MIDVSLDIEKRAAEFASELRARGISFHPDEDFSTSRNNHGQLSFSPEEAAVLNARMSGLRAECETVHLDICDVMSEESVVLMKYRADEANWLEIQKWLLSSLDIAAKNPFGRRTPKEEILEGHGIDPKDADIVIKYLEDNYDYEDPAWADVEFPFAENH